MKSPVNTRYHRPLAMLWLMCFVAMGCQENPIAVSEQSSFTAVDEGVAARRPETLDPALCDPDEHTFTIDIDNRYFPLPVGRQWVYEGEEDGASVGLRITVLDETEMIGEVTTRVVEEYETEDDEVVEISRNYFAQSEEGTVCYFGEDVDIYEDGEIVSNDGAWRADEPGNAPGIFMPKNPKLNMEFAQEFAPGIAEDRVEIIDRGETVTVPYGTSKKTIRTRDFNPLDGDSGEKVYARDVGLFVDEALELVSID